MRHRGSTHTGARTLGGLAAVAVIALASCGGAAGDGGAGGAGDDGSVTVPPVDDEQPDESGLDGPWRMVELTLDGDRHLALDDWPVTMVIEGDAVFGAAACNGYGGSLDAERDRGGGRFVVDELSWTEMGCEPAVMEMEQWFLTALAAVDSYELADNLHLAAAGTATNIELEREAPVEPAALVGTTWVLDTVIDGDAATNSPAMEAATLRFADDGTFDGATVCRTFTGAWVESGAGIAVTELTMDGECPADLAELDGAIVAVLENPAVSIDGARLTLAAAGGAGLSYRVADAGDTSTAG